VRKLILADPELPFVVIDDNPCIELSCFFDAIQIASSEMIDPMIRFVLNFKLFFVAIVSSSVEFYKI